MKHIDFIEDERGPVTEVGDYLEVTYVSYPDYPDVERFVHGRVQIRKDMKLSEKDFLTAFLIEQQRVFSEMNVLIDRKGNDAV